MRACDVEIVLALSGGNALGAFAAGVYQALHERDLMPDWIVGTSIGAINGALIAGSAPERRVEALRGFWNPEDFGMAPWFTGAMDVARRGAAAGWTMAMGRPGIFGPPLSTLGPWSGDRPALFATDELVAMLGRAVDFDRLNDGACRYTATAVDLATGDDVTFDSRACRIGAAHVRASAALPVAFPPVAIGGRWLVDGGLSANLPLDPILGEAATRPRLCIAVDLLPLGQPLPTTIGEAAGRMQDLIFAAQSRRTIARWQAEPAHRDGPGTTLIRLAYTEQDGEVAGKAMDFSGPTAARRWAAGYRAAAKIDLTALSVSAGAMRVVAFA